MKTLGNIIFYLGCIVLIMMMVKLYCDQVEPGWSHPVHQQFAIDHVHEARESVANLMKEAKLMSREEEAKKYEHEMDVLAIVEDDLKRLKSNEPAPR